MVDYLACILEELPRHIGERGGADTQQPKLRNAR